MRRIIAVTVLLMTTSPVLAASDSYCTQWARSASGSATTIRQVDQKWAWCLNQDADPPVLEAPLVKTVQRSKVEASSSCRRYRSFNSRTGTYLDYSGKKRRCER